MEQVLGLMRKHVDEVRQLKLSRSALLHQASSSTGSAMVISHNTALEEMLGLLLSMESTCTKGDVCLILCLIICLW
jgi:hypothetical protein